MHKFTCSCCNRTYCGQSKRHFFVRVPEHLGMTPVTGKRVKNPKKSAIFDYILLNEKKFKLHLKESFLIKRDKAELNRNIYSYPLELFD